MEAVSAYIGELRAVRKMTGTDVMMEARRLFPHIPEPLQPNYVTRLEKWDGKTSPQFDQVVAVVLALGGSMEHVAELLRNEAATVEYARRLARAWARLLSDRDAIDAMYRDLGPDALLSATEADEAGGSARRARGFFAWWRSRMHKRSR